MPEPLTLVNSVGRGISILGWVISPIMSKLISKCWSYLHDVAGSSANNLQNLEENVEHLKLILEAARVSPDDEKRWERWVKELRSAFYDAEDILDAIDYHHLKCKAMLRHQSEKASLKKDFNVPNESKKELRETLKRIEGLIDEGHKLLPLLHLTTSGDNTKGSPKQTTGSLSKSTQTTSQPLKVFGLDEDAKKIISMLNDDTAADHSIIGIHGISGSGKTTLVQYVCDCVKKKNSGVPYVEVIMWIHVSQNFSVKKIYKEMLKMASGQEVEHISLDKLETDLQESLKRKRFLLVLDDVWYPETEPGKDNLNKLLSPLKEAGRASRVLVTTRNADAAKFVGAQKPMLISQMSEEEFFKMFMHYALDNSTVSDEATRSKFETIGKDIAALLQRSPLAAKTVAVQLKRRTRRAEDIGFWIDTLNSGLLSDTMGALLWSYHQLEEHVRQCFAYLSMFPRRYEFTRDELVRMWMAQGFGDTSNNSDMESAAGECFEVLVSTSFIQLKRKIDPDQEYYTVHDLLHDLAGKVAGTDCYRIENDMVDHQIPQNVRYLFIDSNKIEELMEHIVKLDTLRTLVMSNSRSATKITAKEFKRMLKGLKKLRFVCVWLGLEDFGPKVIPECIGELKHLRFFCLEGFLSSDGDIIELSEVIELPTTFTKLYHLQELVMPYSSKVHCLDGDHMADLENLRHIGDIQENIPDIGRMHWLQTLGGFTVKREKGYEITQLENMNCIRGDLSINGLGNIQSKEDARRAYLSNKQHVTSLSLNWKPKPKEDEETGSSSRKKQKTAAGRNQQVVTANPEEILEALHPPALLEKLTIEDYDGSTFPSWLSGEDGKLKHLEELNFNNCHGSGSQLRFSRPLPKLHSLDIDTCSWNALPDNIKQLASLEELFIHRCTNIQSLPELPSSLKKLQITVCGNIKTLPELPPSLKDLEISWCENIKKLPELPPSLEELRCPRALVDSYPDKQAIDRIKINTW